MIRERDNDLIKKIAKKCGREQAIKLYDMLEQVRRNLEICPTGPTKGDRLECAEFALEHFDKFKKVFLKILLG